MTHLYDILSVLTKNCIWWCYIRLKIGKYIFYNGIGWTAAQIFEEEIILQRDLSDFYHMCHLNEGTTRVPLQGRLSNKILTRSLFLKRFHTYPRNFRLLKRGSNVHSFLHLLITFLMQKHARGSYEIYSDLDWCKKISIMDLIIINSSWGIVNVTCENCFVLWNVVLDRNWFDIEG